MNIAIVGSRSIQGMPLKHFQIINKTILNHIGDNLSLVDCIISGGAAGVDQIAEHFAKEHQIREFRVYLPQWNKYGKKAGFLRNKLIVENADTVLIFWDGESKGTQHDIQICEDTYTKHKVWIWKDLINLERTRIPIK